MSSRLAGRVQRGQELAESLMTLTLTPQRPSGMVKNDDGYDVPGFDALTAHRGKVQGTSASTSDTLTRYVKIGRVELPVVEGGLHIPIGAPVPKAGAGRGRGWEYLVSAVGRLDDVALLGKRYLVVGVPTKSFATARRLDVVEIPAAEEA